MTDPLPLINVESAGQILSPEEQVRVFSTLYDVGNAILGTLNVAEVLQLVVDRVCEFMGLKKGFLILLDEERPIVVTPLNSSLTPAEIDSIKKMFAEDPFIEPLTDSTIIHLRDFPHTELQHQLHLTAGLICPLVAAEKLLGVLVLGDRTSGAPYSRQDIVVAGLFCQQASIALHSAKQYEHVEKLARTDGLTGVSNHRYFKQRFAVEIERADRYEHELSLLVIDIDRFKQINDTFGHLTGDLLLKMVANLLKRVTRNTDLLARYGGDEFMVLLVETPKVGAMRVVERILDGIHQMDFEAVGLQNQTLTLSIGVATFPEDAQSMLDLIEHADQALYTAKAQGRDGFVLYDPTHNS
ncbi:MAG: GGDEF domain-containing protein [Gemmatimonadetes bacterium]|nr:MAG: GGDEF domain-containing protein [Gemmatimonadota bacterium]